MSEFNWEELNLIRRLKKLREGIKLPQSSFERMLSSLPKEDVTNYYLRRYSFSDNNIGGNNFLMGKYLIALILVIAAIAGFTYLKNGQLNPQMTQNGPTAQNVTADNVDSTLNQTDQTINQTMTQMDQDLNSLDQNSSEDDLNGI